MSDIEIPLFPLESVLYPGGPLPLRIFEPRYLDMVGRCMKRHEGFGVVAIETGSEVGSAETFDTGTLAEIMDWYQHAQGVLGITARGKKRFKLKHTTRQDDGLYLGRVEYLEPEPRVALPASYASIAEFLRQVLRRLGSRYRDIATRFDDASWVSYRLAEILPMAIEVKQALLEMEDALARLDELVPLLGRLRSDET